MHGLESHWRTNHTTGKVPRVGLRGPRCADFTASGRQITFADGRATAEQSTKEGSWGRCGGLMAVLGSQGVGAGGHWIWGLVMGDTQGPGGGRAGHVGTPKAMQDVASPAVFSAAHAPGPVSQLPCLPLLCLRVGPKRTRSWRVSNVKSGTAQGAGSSVVERLPSLGL